MSAEQTTTPGIGALFAGFFGMGIIGFGGVLPFVRRLVVDQRHWLTPAEFTDLLALCQFLPGPNVVNMSIAIGARSRGVLGSLAAVTGLLAAPMAIVLALGGIYSRYQAVPIVHRAFAGLAAAAVGLIVAVSIKVGSPLLGNKLGLLIAAIAFGVVAILRIPLLPTMLVMAPLSILVCWRFSA